VSVEGEYFPLDWRAVEPAERRRWFETLWDAVVELRNRYELCVRSRWWEDARQVEALAALAVWVDRYDSGEWDDPPGKLALLFDLERVAAALRDGVDPFNAERDRPTFERHLLLLGCRAPPPQNPGIPRSDPPRQ